MARFDFFISYAGPDEQSAIRIHDLLAAEGRVFLSRLQGVHGAWDDTIAAAQRDSLSTVAILSSRSPEGYYQKEEIACAIALYRQGRHHVIPLLLEPLPSEEIPFGLRRLQHVLVSGKLESAIAEVVRLSRLPFPGAALRKTAPRIRISHSAEQSEEIELDHELLTLGRGDSNNVVLADPRVSTRHAEVFVRGGRVWVRDLGSTNGVYCNGRRITQPEAIDTNTHVRLSRDGPSIVLVVDVMGKTVMDPSS